MDRLYLFYSQTNDEDNFDVPLESLIVLFVYSYLKNVQIEIKLIKQQSSDKKTYNIKANFLKSVKLDVDIDDILYASIFPTIVIEGNVYISGLCAVVRQIIKSALNQQVVQAKDLLGFKNACLMAPNEVSIWTKFCEIDMIAMCQQLQINGTTFNVPTDIIRFENHLEQPVRIHNIYKVAQNNSNEKIDTKLPKDQLNLTHCYAEGPFMTLSDIILFPQIYLTLAPINFKLLQPKIPRTIQWFELMTENIHIQRAKEIIVSTAHQIVTVLKPEETIKNESLYKVDPNRYKPYKRMYTKQLDIEQAIEIVQNLIDLKRPERPFGYEIPFDWNQVPLEATPSSGALPDSRASRKCEQLENLTKAVLKLAKVGDKIVDFCSGSGHLGLLLAVALPQCQIILLENKEQSLKRAKARIKILNLTNVKLIQSNLDYYNGIFDIGVCLHGCGVATDLVLRQCLNVKASFVVCPCCYGGVHNCHHLTYPRSEVYRSSSLSLKDYLVLGHAADQTQCDATNQKTQQGHHAMDIIDNDRMLHAVEHNYHVQLGKLEPSSCTPKNNLLVGWPM